ncbi:diguanylate cyclase [bacterium]|nr:MAG: diguanylate cyclase [bacterium]
MGIEGFKDETVVTSIGALEGISEKEPAVDFLGGPAMGMQVILAEGEVVVGRSKDANIVVEDEAISRCHFKIKVRDKIATIEDLNSTNGTFVNGMRIKQQVLKANDKIQISSATVLRFSYVDTIDKNSHERFYEMALYDPVTAAHTKRYFLDRIQHEFAHSARRNLPLSLAIFDLDFFKKVNDTYGHPAGDFVLHKVSEITKGMIRREDIFARYGGEEFVILMRDTEEADAVALAERLRKKIATSDFAFESKRIPVTVSIGVSCLKDSSFKSYADLIRAADEYLYFSKSNGRNRVSAKSLLTS